MLEALKQWDRSMFEWVNNTTSNPFFDAVLPWTRHAVNWIPLYIIIVAYIIIILKKKAWLPILGLAVTLLVSDQLSATLIKKTVRRLRPCNDIDMAGHVHLRIESCGSGYSFVSSHASNHFAIGVFLCLFFYPKYKYLSILWLLWAAVIAYAQVYVGVHYPFDTICGALLGTLLGIIIFTLIKKTEHRLW